MNPPSSRSARRRQRLVGNHPQLRSIHIHQLFRIQYTRFELDTVNIDWWIWKDFCLVNQEPFHQGEGATGAVGRGAALGA